MRQSWQRRWIKLYPVQCLEGSIRYQLESDERGVWYDLLNLAAICGEPGLISDRDGRSYPHSFIANRLNIPLELLERTLQKCEAEGRIHENKTTGIVIANWKVYQSEYERQKPYREARKRKSSRTDESAMRISLSYRRKKKELGRDLNTEEMEKLKEEVNAQLDKEERDEHGGD